MSTPQYYANCLGVHADSPLSDYTLCGITLDEPVSTLSDMDDLRKVPPQPVTCDDCKAIIRRCAEIECT